MCVCEHELCRRELSEPVSICGSERSASCWIYSCCPSSTLAPVCVWCVCTRVTRYWWELRHWYDTHTDFTLWLDTLAGYSALCLKTWEMLIYTSDCATDTVPLSLSKTHIHTRTYSTNKSSRCVSSLLCALSSQWHKKFWEMENKKRLDWALLNIERRNGHLCLCPLGAFLSIDKLDCAPD